MTPRIEWELRSYTFLSSGVWVAYPYNKYPSFPKYLGVSNTMGYMVVRGQRGQSGQHFRLVYTCGKWSSLCYCVKIFRVSQNVKSD